MKTVIYAILVIQCLSISCKEEERMGVCTACCDSNGNKICKPNFSNKMCTDYNKNRVDGLDWTFTETTLACPPPRPN